MEAVVVVLMIVAVVNFWLKLTFVKPWQVWAFAALAAGFVYAMQPLAIMQSKTQLIDALRNHALMQDIALIISLEVVLEMAFCLWATRYYTHDELRPSAAFFPRHSGLSCTFCCAHKRHLCVAWLEFPSHRPHGGGCSDPCDDYR